VLVADQNYQGHIDDELYKTFENSTHSAIENFDSASHVFIFPLFN
jgi:hypothetical protein